MARLAPFPEHLVAALRRQDRPVFERFVIHCMPYVHDVAFRMTHDHDRAADIAQEVFMRAFQALPMFKGRSSLCTWIYRIAANTTLMELRKHTRRPPVDPLSQVDAEQVATLIDSAETTCKDNPERRLVEHELGEMINDALSTLSPNLRIAFILRDIEQLSVAETAQALGLSETAVKSRTHRARKALREQLGDYVEGLRPKRM